MCVCGVIHFSADPPSSLLRYSTHSGQRTKQSSPQRGFACGCSRDSIESLLQNKWHSVGYCFAFLIIMVYSSRQQHGVNSKEFQSWEISTAVPPYIVIQKFATPLRRLSMITIVWLPSGTWATRRSYGIFRTIATFIYVGRIMLTVPVDTICYFKSGGNFIESHNRMSQQLGEMW